MIGKRWGIAVCWTRGFLIVSSKNRETNRRRETGDGGEMDKVLFYCPLKERN